MSVCLLLLAVAFAAATGASGQADQAGAEVEEVGPVLIDEYAPELGLQAPADELSVEAPADELSVEAPEGKSEYGYEDDDEEDEEDETEEERLLFTTSTDTAALCDFYDSVVSTGPLSNWRCNPVSGNACSGGWVGTQCNSKNRVKSINLQGFQLNGGTIPTTFGGMRKLTELVLGDASGAGQSGLSLTGTIPKEIGSLTRLRTLVLGSNLLTGKIRRRLSNLQRLEVLWLLNNDLSGSVPSELGLLTRITDLDLSDNALAGR